MNLTSFETVPAGPPQDEGGSYLRLRRQALMLRSERSSHLEARGRRLLVMTAILATLSCNHAVALTNEEIALYSGADREKILEEGAKREGQVVLYSAMIVNQALRPVVEAFSKKYPYVKPSYWRADAPETLAKLSAEQRAGNVVVDLIEGSGVGETAIQAGFALPFISPRLAEYPESRRDPRHLWASTRLSYFGVGYNTKLVAPGAPPKTYDELLDPKWKGKLAWRIGQAGGMELMLSTLRIAWGEEKAMAYFRKLKDQQIVNFGIGSARTLVDRVMAGEYPVALNIYAHHPLISAKSGAPVDTQLLDPVTTTSAILVVPKGAKHPHAAMLLADFLLSKEGQSILARAEYFPSHPDVQPLETITKAVPANAGVAEVFINPTQMPEYNERSGEIWQEIFR
jgi:iron(III) transport system substrate-binding protein